MVAYPEGMDNIKASAVFKGKFWKELYCGFIEGTEAGFHRSPFPAFEALGASFVLLSWDFNPTVDEVPRFKAGVDGAERVSGVSGFEGLGFTVWTRWGKCCLGDGEMLSWRLCTTATHDRFWTSWSPCLPQRLGPSS